MCSNCDIINKAENCLKKEKSKASYAESTSFSREWEQYHRGEQAGLREGLSQIQDLKQKLCLDLENKTRG